MRIDKNFLSFYNFLLKYNLRLLKENLYTKTLLLNGGKAFGESGSRLNLALYNVAKDSSQTLGHKVLETHINMATQ